MKPVCGPTSETNRKCMQCKITEDAYIEDVASNSTNTRMQWAKKATIHQVTTMLVTSKNIPFPGHNHLLTTGADKPDTLSTSEGDN